MKDFFKMVLGSCLGVILASVLVLFIFFSIMGAMIGSVASKIMGGSERAEITLHEESVLLLDLKGALAETPEGGAFTANLFSDEAKKTFTLNEVLRAIEVARENPKVEAIVLKLEEAKMGFAAARDVREALLRFKESGKKIYAFANNYGRLPYYVSSVADEVYGGPMGSVGLSGLASNISFYKGLLNKLGVEMQVFKVGTFKGAVEPLVLDKLSAENRMQIETYLGGLWNGLKSEVATSRGLEESFLQAYADNGSFWLENQKNVEAHLLDSLVHSIDLDDVLALKVAGDADADLNYLRVDEVLKLKQTKKQTDGKVAVVYAEGNIVENDPTEGNPFASGRYITTGLVEELRELADDDDVDAIVLRVNSGGGALSTSELIANEVERLREKKPIVASMGNAAASGGYYISSHASAIVASPYTITGSIGIFGLIPNLKGLHEKIGIKTDVVKTAKMADMMSGVRSFTEEEKAVVQGTIERGYQLFLNRVSSGRGMTVEEVDKVGQGRVWLGKDALELGLVDKLGGLQVAIDEAARLAGLESYKVEHRIEQENPFDALLKMNISASFAYLQMSNTERAIWSVVQHIEAISGVQAVPPFTLDADLTSTQEQQLLPLATL